MTKLLLVALMALSMTACNTFGGEVITKYDSAGKITERSCKGFQVSLGESKTECMKTKGISDEGTAVIKAVVETAVEGAKEVLRVITPPILGGGQ